MSGGEYEEMNELKRKQEQGIIQIKPADKGGGVVIMNTNDYVSEMSNQLTATTTVNSIQQKYYETANENELKMDKIKVE